MARYDYINISANHLDISRFIHLPVPFSHMKQYSVEPFALHQEPLCSQLASWIPRRRWFLSSPWYWTTPLSPPHFHLWFIKVPFHFDMSKRQNVQHYYLIKRLQFNFLSIYLLKESSFFSFYLDASTNEQDFPSSHTWPSTFVHTDYQ